MIRIVVAQAESVSGAPIEDAQIVIEGDTLSRERMAKDAAEIVAVLYETLPQGTWIRLVAAVAERWAVSMEGHSCAKDWDI